MTNIPQTVRSVVKLHAAATEEQLARVGARLLELPALSAEGKRMRVRRNRLSDELAAWDLIASLLDGR